MSKACAKDHLRKNSDKGYILEESSCCKILEVGFENLNIYIEKISVLL